MQLDPLADKHAEADP
jgi:hypothetical protein